VFHPHRESNAQLHVLRFVAHMQADRFMQLGPGASNSLAHGTSAKGIPLCAVRLLSIVILPKWRRPCFPDATCPKYSQKKLAAG
jgi:hypothetical protein